MMRNSIFLLALMALTLLSGCGGSGGDNGVNPPPPPPDKRAEWTVMMYMGGDNNLAIPALIDIDELEQVGSTDKVHFTVLADVYCEYSGPYGVIGATIQDDSGKPVVPMMHITKHPEEGVQSHLADTDAVLKPLEGFNSADPNNLKNFIKWSTQRFPAKRYALVIWDHGSSWLPGRAGSAAVSDDYEANGNAMYIHEIEAAIKGAGVHFELIDFDACNMASVEVAYQLKDVTNYICASQRTEPGGGNNYTAIASYLTAHPTASSESYSRTIIDSYIASYTSENASSVTRSLLRTDRLPAVAQAVNQLTPLLSNPSIISPDRLRKSFFETVRFFQDADLCNYSYVLPYHIQNTALNTALSIVRDKVHNAVIYNRTFTCTKEGPSWSFGTRDFGNGQDINMTGAEGLNIYLPTENDWTQSNFGYYNSIAFNKATGWSYVIAHAYEGIPYLGTSPGNWMAMLIWSTHVDLDLWVFEPAGYNEFYPASPCLGPNSLNGYLSQDSHWTGISAEAYKTKPEVIWGPYFFLGVYYMPSLFPPQSSAWCMLAIGNVDDFENGDPLTTDEYYISATQPNDPDFGKGVVYFGFAIYNPGDGYWYFAEGDRGGDMVKVDQTSEIGSKLKSLRPDISKTEKPYGLESEEIYQLHQEGLKLADQLRTKLKNKS